MIEIKTKQQEIVEHSPFVMPYAGQIIVHSFSGEELSVSDQVEAATRLSENNKTFRTIAVDVDEFLPRFTLTIHMEAEGDRDALQNLCGAAIEAWATVGNDVEDLEFVEAHLVYEPELTKDNEIDTTANIGDARYTIDELELTELDDFGNQARVEAYEVFCRARDEAAT
jgi:hypothetical protein